MAQIDRNSGFVGELGMKAPCNCATTTAIALSGLMMVDGYPCTTTDNNGLGTRVLGCEGDKEWRRSTGIVAL